MKPRFRVEVLCSVLLLAVCGLASAQSYPSRPVRMVIPWAAGGPADVVGRLLFERLGERLRQPIVIENRAGAGGAIGAAAAAKSPADGYTLVFTVDATLTVAPVINPNTPFDPVADFAPVSLALEALQALIVNPALPVTSVADLVALARKHPLNFASGGLASPGHLSMLLFMAGAGIEMSHVPYKGIADALPGVLSGDVPMLIAPTAPVWSLARSGKLRVLAVMGSRRSPLGANVPTMKDLGYTSNEVSVGNYVLLAPAGTPAPVVDQLNSELGETMKLPAVQARLAELELIPVNSSPAETADRLKRDLAKWRAVADKLKLRRE